MVFKSVSITCGLRYVRAKRNNKFVSFISFVSLAGIALGVMVLITVVSVMNGFSKEIRAKMLSVAPHLTIDSPRGIHNWEHIRNITLAYDKVKGVLPYIDGVGMVVGRGNVEGIQVKGIQPKYVNNVFPLEEQLVLGELSSIDSGEYNLLIGDELAYNLKVGLYDKISIIAPQAQVTIGGVIPRIRQFTITGIFHSGTPFDKHGAFVGFQDASKLYKKDESASGLQIKLHDELDAPELNKIFKKIESLEEYNIYDWTSVYSDFFDAVQMEKRVMWCILVLIIAVAAFNLVSSMVMLVTDKKGDIAILRTIGVSRGAILRLFILTGMVIGVLGTVIGLILGLILATNAGALVRFIESIFHINFVAENVYYIGYLPSDIHRSDVIIICLSSLILSFIATIYPAYKATKIHPAEALKNER
ncbi:MAG: lipoprotein-releasing ABC transporter permease subunit [Francisellaceae bacterium]|jgi:lipoprotein-releasing system permease protein|nr:lipoprotein-releasing ABC transporter permease subunit [Francisellaceae bacterium]MBT6206472.1 lipoprotein-releasing ABC transporter permease subunit [Francisellaceae bacterium]MBT6538924.1 lipoprotein-releasing ABC transporter permease subunit [Francisellaceae bacterium]